MDISNIHRNVIRFFKHHKIPISAEHKPYLKHTRRKLVLLYPTKQDREKLDLYSDLILALFQLDLEALRPHLQVLYSAKPRGTPPRDPIQMFRSLLRSHPLRRDPQLHYLGQKTSLPAFVCCTLRIWTQHTWHRDLLRFHRPSLSGTDRPHHSPSSQQTKGVWSKEPSAPRPGSATGRQSSGQQGQRAWSLSFTSSQPLAQTHRLTLTEALSALFFRDHRSGRR
jgi:hypothetical protein